MKTHNFPNRLALLLWLGLSLVACSPSAPSTVGTPQPIGPTPIGITQAPLLSPTPRVVQATASALPAFTAQPAITPPATQLPATAATAEARIYRFDRLDVDITVQLNGDMAIVDTQTYTYVSGPFVGSGFRNIDKRYLATIKDFGVSEAAHVFSSSQSQAPYTFYTSEDETQFHIDWWYGKPAIPSTRTFDLRI